MNKESEKGCLVIHGLTGTPATMNPVIDKLFEAGFRVEAPLLPGHGTKSGDLAGLTWKEWWNAVLGAYHKLQKEVREVSCIGLSLGSLLTLKLAAEMGCEIKATVAMSTPLVLGRSLEYLACPLVRYSPARWIYRFQEKNWVESVADISGRDFYRANSYEKISINSVIELFKLKKIVKTRLKKITSPVLVIHGGDDKVAPLRNVGLMKKLLKSNIVDIVIMERSRHIVTLDYDKDIVAKSVIAFLERFS